MKDQYEKLGLIKDRIDNLSAGLQMRGRDMDRIHVDSLREVLPEISAELREIFTALSGEDPWAPG